MYYISSDKTILETINKRINDWMMANVKDYNAEKWGRIIKHSDGRFALEINDDSRNPLRLRSDERTKLIDTLDDSWFPED